MELLELTLTHSNEEEGLDNLKEEIDKTIASVLETIRCKAKSGEDAEHYAFVVWRLMEIRNDMEEGDEPESDEPALGDEDGRGDLSFTFRGIARDEALGILRDVQKMAEK